MKKSITAEEFDRKFDDGEDISEYVDWSSARRVNDAPGETKAKRVNVDMPAWMVSALDRRAERLNISRQAVIKSMLDAQLKADTASRA